MKTIQVGTIPEVKYKRNKPLSIAAKILKKAGFEDGQSVQIIQDKGRLVLAPVEDKYKAEVLKAVEQGIADFKAGRCSPPITTLEELDAYLNS